MKEIIAGNQYFLRGNIPEKNSFEAEKLVKNNSLQGKYSERKNTTKEGEHIDGDILYEKQLEKRIDTERGNIVGGENN